MQRRRGGTGGSLPSQTIRVNGRRTGIRLEPTIWEALCDIAASQQREVEELVKEIARTRGSRSLSAVIRVYVVAFYRAAAADPQRKPDC